MENVGSGHGYDIPYLRQADDSDEVFTLLDVDVHLAQVLTLARFLWHAS